jgi:hypothetical protein
MSSAFFVEASVIEGPEEGHYKKIHRTFEEALADFVRLYPLSEDAELRWSS